MAEQQSDKALAANESLYSIKYYQDLTVKQLQDQLEKNEKVGKPVDKAPIGQRSVLDFSTVPLATLMRKGPEGHNPPCLCGHDCTHVSFFDAMQRDMPTDFCPNRNSFIVGRLPVWLTGLKNKVEFVKLPTVYHLYNVLSRGTYWWSRLNGQTTTGAKFHISREARLLLMSATGKPLHSTLFLGTKELLGQETSEAAMHRLRNWLTTLDGLLISVLLGSQGHTELCNWDFFDKIMQTYLKSAVSDLFNISDRVDTYYARLKASRNLMKDFILKERTLLPRRPGGKVFDGNFWFFDRIIEVLDLDVRELSPKQLISIAYLTQTRSCGLPPKPIEVKALKKWKETVGREPIPLTTLQRFDVSRAVDSLTTEMKTKGNFQGLLSTASMHSKISLSNSASFTVTRQDGGKVESARSLLNELPDDCPFFDLESGKVLFTFGREDPRLTPGEKLFHFSILRAVESLSCVDDDKPHIGDIRVSTVLEPGKARVITISRTEHASILHPLAHFFSVLLSTFESSKAGLTAANHMWDTFKRLGRKNVPADGIFSATNPALTFLGSEDWSEATDSLNPHFVVVVLDGFMKSLRLPKFYVRLCRTLLTMPRRVYGKGILNTGDFANPELIKFNGILMGDPLCKAMLHLSHLISRRISRNKLAQIGSQSITPPFLMKGSVRFGSVPNTLLLKKLMPRELYLRELKAVFKRLEEKTDNGSQHKNLLSSILSLKRE